MKRVLIIFTTFLYGCSTPVPVKNKFPDRPTGVEACAPLEQLKSEPKISDVSRVIDDNYTNYRLCSIKNDAWNQWYEIQKSIFEK